MHMAEIIKQKNYYRGNFIWVIAFNQYNVGSLSEACRSRSTLFSKDGTDFFLSYAKRGLIRLNTDGKRCHMKGLFLSP